MTDILIPQDNARERQLLSLAARSGQLYSDLMSEFYCDYHVALQTACHKVAVLEQTVREQAEKLRNARSHFPSGSEVK